MGADVTPWQAFTFSAGLILIGLPGALPYFAAVDQMLRFDLSPPASLAAIAFYCLVFSAPLVVLAVVFRMLRGDLETVVGRIEDFIGRWGRRIVMILLLALGALMVLDGVGWFFDRPLFQMGS